MKLLQKAIAIALATGLVLCSTACTKKETAPETPVTPPGGIIEGVSAENYPRIDGSTANRPLIAELYSRACGVSLEDAEALIDTSGTSESWRNMMYEQKDLLLVYEAPETIKQEMEDSQAKLDIQPVGKDALVFLINADNPVDSLTQQQLIDIYTGKITDWSEVGGTAGSIAPFQRNLESGSQTMFLKLLMKDTEPMTPPTELVQGFMGGLIDGVANYDGSGGAIGYSVYFYVSEMNKNPDLKILKVDGVEPTPETIGNGSYPLINDFFVVIPNSAKEGSPERLIRDWLLSDEGDKLLTETGYVPVPRDGSAKPEAEAPKKEIPNTDPIKSLLPTYTKFIIGNGYEENPTEYDLSADNLEKLLEVMKVDTWTVAEDVPLGGFSAHFYLLDKNGNIAFVNQLSATELLILVKNDSDPTALTAMYSVSVDVLQPALDFLNEIAK